jgi:hypothetical protein
MGMRAGAASALLFSPCILHAHAHSIPLAMLLFFAVAWQAAPLLHVTMLVHTSIGRRAGAGFPYPRIVAV